MKLSLDKLKEILGKGFVSGNNYYSKCPYCGGDEFGISLQENHQFGCFRKKKCGESGNIFKLLKKLDREDLIEQKKYVPNRQIEILTSKVEEKELDFELPPTIKMPLGYKRIFANEYLQQRRVDLNENEFGVSLLPSLKNYVLYPIKIQDEVKGYIGRATFQTKTKYRNSKTDFVNLLGGYLSDTNSICIVVEGIFDMINVKSILRQLNLDISVRCTFGAKISSNQIKMLKKERFETIILFFDLDVLKIIKQKSFELSKYFDVYAMFCPNEQMDAGDVDLELFSQILLNHKPLSYIANLCTNTKLL